MSITQEHIVAIKEVLRISDRKHPAWDKAKEAIAALGDGVVVPLEPTEEMLAAGFNRSSINSQLLQGIYKAMLAAAPQNKDR